MLTKVGLICPRCEKPLEGHEDSACRRRMSRRYFFGALGGLAVAAVAIPKVAGITSADVIALQLERVRPQLNKIFENTVKVTDLWLKWEENRSPGFVGSPDSSEYIFPYKEGIYRVHVGDDIPFVVTYPYKAADKVWNFQTSG